MIPGFRPSEARWHGPHSRSCLRLRRANGGANYGEDLEETKWYRERVMGGKGSGRKLDRKKAAAKEAKRREQSKKRKPLTPRQSVFLANWVRTRSLKQAALAAQYSPKNPSESGAQVLAAIKEKAPEIMDRIGLTLETSIRKYLVPLLHAEETKFAQFEGQFTDAIDVEALGIRLGATRTLLELHGAIGAGAELAIEEGRRAGIDVIIMDMPHPGPGYAGDDAINITPTSGNGNKPKAKEIPEDPRPKD